jgi:tetratricopeptide (TPR) repeat protein
MIKKTLTIALLFLIRLSNAQDTLVHFKDLTFASTLEETILTDHFVNKKTDPFLLFMANGTLLNEGHLKNDKIRFYDHLKTLKEEASNKKNDKKIKYLYDDIHKSFLQKYELQNKFEDIFYNGNYNCVSASALYALTFEEAGIPYTLKEEPTHVYLIAYPKQERIVIETTTPQSGYRTIDQSFKEAYVKMLKDQKLISGSEYASQSVNTLFDKFYFNGEVEINLLNLVGIQYSNDGIYKLEEKKYEEAYHQFQKSYLFFPTERISYMLFLSCLKTFEEFKDKPGNQARYLAELSKFKKFDMTSDVIKSEFAHVLHKDLIETTNKEHLEKYYNELYPALTDTLLQKEIRFLYNYENGRSLYNMAMFKEAIPYFEEALKIKPKSPETNNILINSISESYSVQRNAQELISQLEMYGQKYPSININKNFKRLLVNAYLVEFQRDYDFGNIPSGEKYRSSFETFMDKNPSQEVDPQLLGRAYSLASVYYFKKGQVSKSKSILNKGLSYDPYNYELLVRQRMIK